MTIVSRDEERVVRRLVEFAGDPLIVEEALQDLRQELDAPPSLAQLLEKILELRDQRGLGLPAQAVAAR